MADDTDKFVLEYVVKVDRAEKDLDQLSKRLETVNKRAGASSDELKGFAEDALKSFRGLIPELGAAEAAISLIGRAAGPAAVGVGLLVLALKQAEEAAKRLNEQSIQARESGMSQQQLENFQRQVRGGKVTREMASSGAQNVQSFLVRANSNFDPNSEERKVLRVLGLPQGTTDSNLFLNTAAAHWHDMSEKDAMAQARRIGIVPELAKRMREKGAALGESAMTAAEIKAHEEAAKAAENLADKHAALSESVQKAMLGFDTWSMNFKAGFLDWLAHPMAGQHVFEPMTYQAKGFEEINETARLNRQEAKAVAEENKRTAADQKQQANDALKHTSEENKKYQEEQARLELAISLFSSSVATFSNAVMSREQVLALWAGSAGSGGGLSDAGTPGSKGNAPRAPAATVTTTETHNPGNVEAGKWADAHGATGRAGRWAVFPDDETGRAAIKSRITSYKAKTLTGIMNKYAPPSENDTPHYIKTISQWTGIDPNKPLTDDQYEQVVNSIIRFEGAHSTAGRTAIQVSGGAAPPTTKAYTRDAWLLGETQKAVAEKAHLNVRQLQQGRGSHGDVEWAEKSLYNEWFNREQQLKAALSVPGLSDQERGPMLQERRLLDTKITGLRDNWNLMLDRTRPGGRELTDREPQIPMNLTFNGYDNKQIWSEIDNRMRSTYGAIANDRSTKLVK
jgi:hypothetical protein